MCLWEENSDSTLLYLSEVMQEALFVTEPVLWPFLKMVPQHWAPTYIYRENSCLTRIHIPVPMLLSWNGKFSNVKIVTNELTTVKFCLKLPFIPANHVNPLSTF